MVLYELTHKLTWQRYHVGVDVKKWVQVDVDEQCPLRFYLICATNIAN